MPVDPTQRLLGLLLTLHGSGAEPVPFAALRERFPVYTSANPEAGRRKFERDKDRLRQLGVIIEFVGSGEEGGYRLDRRASFLQLPVKLDPEDRALLGMLIREALANAAFPHSAALRLVHAKLGGLPPGPTGVRVRHPVRDEPGVAAQVERLTEALLHRSHATIRYQGPGREPGTRRLAPYGLFLQAGHWYVVGHDGRSDEVRVFRLSRILELETREAPPPAPEYEIPPDFQLAEYSALDPVKFHAHPPETVEVLVDKEIDHIARGLWGPPAEGTSNHFRFTSSNHEAVLEQVLRLGPRAEILGPGPLRERMAQSLRALLAAHGEVA